MRRYVIDQSQCSAEVQCNFTAVDGVADSHELKLEKVHCFGIWVDFLAHKRKYFIPLVCS